MEGLVLALALVSTGTCYQQAGGWIPATIAGAWLGLGVGCGALALRAGCASDQQGGGGTHLSRLRCSAAASMISWSLLVA
jgi:hypothetical protein